MAQGVKDTSERERETKKKDADDIHGRIITRNRRGVLLFRQNKS